LWSSLKSLFHIISLYSGTFIPSAKQFIGAMLEELCALCLELCPCCFFDQNLFQSVAHKTFFLMAQTGDRHLGPDQDCTVDDAELHRDTRADWEVTFLNCLYTCKLQNLCRRFTVQESNFPICPCIYVTFKVKEI
jgi:hypothetical protein